MDAQLIYLDARSPLTQIYLSEAYKWARLRPEAYLDGTGYNSREEFLEAPPGAVEFIVLLSGQPSALLTFFRLDKGEYRVGLIVSPAARLRRLMATLRCVRGWLPNAGVQKLWVLLPLDDCYNGARNLAARLGFDRTSETHWKLEASDGNTRE